MTSTDFSSLFGKAVLGCSSVRMETEAGLDKSYDSSTTTNCNRGIYVGEGQYFDPMENPSIEILRLDSDNRYKLCAPMIQLVRYVLDNSESRDLTSLKEFLKQQSKTYIMENCTQLMDQGFSSDDGVSTLLYNRALSYFVAAYFPLKNGTYTDDDKNPYRKREGDEEDKVEGRFLGENPNVKVVYLDKLGAPMDMRGAPSDIEFVGFRDNVVLASFRYGEFDEFFSRIFDDGFLRKLSLCQTKASKPVKTIHIETTPQCTGGYTGFGR